MNANEIVDFATNEFTTTGLAGILTRRAGALIAAARPGSIGLIKPVMESLAVGNIIERTLWLALGRWIGGLRPKSTLWEWEKPFLTQNYDLVREGRWPPLFRGILGALIRVDDHVLTFGDIWISFGVGQDDIDLIPIFQSAALLAEDLHGEAITAFFVFLLEGDAESVSKENISADKIFSYLESEFPPQDSVVGFEAAEAVIAGFIRYTEFLSAMDSLFPAPEVAGVASDLSSRIAKRERLAVEVIDLIKWRFPNERRSHDLYKSVRTTFLVLVRSQLERYSESGLRWSEMKTLAEIIRLTHRFFGVAETFDEAEERTEDLSTSERPVPKQLPAKLPGVKEIIDRTIHQGTTVHDP